MGLFGYKGPGAPFQPGIDQSTMQTGPDPYAGQRPEAAPGFFGKGRKLRDLVGYGLGIAAQRMGGVNPYEKRMDAEAEMQHELVKAQLLQKLKGPNRRAIGLPDGGIAMVDEDSGELQMLRQPDPDKPTQTPLERNIAMIRGFRPELTNEQAAQIAERALLGGYSDQAVTDKIRVKSTAPGKTPGSGGSSSGKITATRVVNGVTYRKINGEWEY